MVFGTGAEMPLLATVPVGQEPVAVAVRNDNEVWVVNHLSDSVSVVRLDGAAPRVANTILVGDEPRDIVFAGPNKSRAFITTAHRGQRRVDPAVAAVPGGGDPKLLTPGVPRADVWVFDAAAAVDPQTEAVPTRIVELFGDTPRALAVSPDGNSVHVAVFNSGNQTTAVGEGLTCQGPVDQPCAKADFVAPGAPRPPGTNVAGAKAPLVAQIVKFNPASGHFEDGLGRNWDGAVRFSLPDLDVFTINAGTLTQTRSVAHVGTTLFNMAVNPVDGTVYVSNTEANNFERFEGPGIFGGTTVQGHLAESRITVIEPNGNAKPRHLNKHIDYNVLPAPPGTKEHSLATPLDMAVSADGRKLYVAAFGSSKIGVYDTQALAENSFDPRSVSAGHIKVTGGGPSGLALDNARNRLYVLTRFDNAVGAIDLGTGQEVVHKPMPNPEPASVIAGRPFLYDANLTSSNGEASCSSCHIFGHTDHLAWDLGNPDDDVTRNPLPIKLEVGAGSTISGLGLSPELGSINGTGRTRDFHPMKGPMVTQTLRGMVNQGAMHWRGDRATGFFGTDTRTSPPFDSRLAFKNFIVAFGGLLGRETLTTEQEMNAFTDFILQVQYPPNAIRRLDNSLTASQRAGRKYFFGCEAPFLQFTVCSGDRPVFNEHRADGVPLIRGLGFTCDGCHTLKPDQGFFGTDGQASFEGLSQIMKIPAIRIEYDKVGMFGNARAPAVEPGNNEFQGPQIRGFGYLHEGSVDTFLRFMRGDVFSSRFLGLTGFFGGDPQRVNVFNFMMAFDSDLAPVTGQQVTLTAARNTRTTDRVNLLMNRAGATFTSKLLGGTGKECELVAAGAVQGNRRAWLYNAGTRVFARPGTGVSNTLADLTAIAGVAGQELTFTCVPFGSGTRVATALDAP